MTRPDNPLLTGLALPMLLIVSLTVRADTPLMLAAFQGDYAQVEELLDSGADVNERAVQRSTALMVAASAGHARIVQLLVSRGARLNLKNEDGWTALMIAVNAGHREVARILVVSGAATDVTGPTGESANSLAVRRGMNLSQWQIDALLDRGKRYISQNQLRTPRERNAFEMFRRVLEIDPGNAQAKRGMIAIADSYLRLARREVERNRLEKATEYIDRGLEVASSHERLLALRQQIASGSRQEDADALATSELDRLLKTARQLVAQGKLQSARDLVLEHLENVPGDPKPTEFLATIDEKLDDQRAVEATGAHERTARALFSGRRWRESLAEVERGLALSPSDSDLLNLKGQILAAIEKENRVKRDVASLLSQVRAQQMVLEELSIRMRIKRRELRSAAQQELKRRQALASGTPKAVN